MGHGGPAAREEPSGQNDALAPAAPVPRGQAPRPTRAHEPRAGRGERAAGLSQDPEEGAAVMGLLNRSTPRGTNRMSHDGRDLFTQRAVVAAALPKHPFYSGRTCPTCPPIKHANGHDPTARGCAMRCIGTARGGCNLPLRDVTWLAAGQCPQCRAETAHGGPILQDVDSAGALRLATAVVEQASRRTLTRDQRPRGCSSHSCMSPATSLADSSPSRPSGSLRPLHVMPSSERRRPIVFVGQRAGRLRRVRRKRPSPGWSLSDSR